MTKPTEKDWHCAGGQKIINPCLSASAEHREGVGAGLLPRPSMSLHSLYSDPDHPGEDMNFPIYSGWWPCQCAPRNMVALAGQSGQWGRHPGRRASGFLNLGAGSEGLFLSIQGVLSIVRPMLIPCWNEHSSLCQLHGTHQALQLCQWQPDPSSNCTPCSRALPLGWGWCPRGCAGMLCPFTQYVFSRAALFIGGDVERRKMSISGGIGQVVAC